ncbi:MAG: hypothetical protein M3N52_06200, partial [Actinomycetota bacterium]|nr:hypothetical protein [Actinomycetota bacterium]
QRSPSPGGGQAAPGVDLELVTRSWPAVLEATKSRSRRLHAFLLQARVVQVSDSTLVLEFPPGYGFHAEHCASDASQAKLGEVLTEVLGAHLRLRCRVADGDDRPPPVGDGHPDASAADEALAVLETEAAEAAGELPGDAEAHELAIETLRRGLGATVVEDQ